MKTTKKYRKKRACYGQKQKRSMKKFTIYMKNLLFKIVNVINQIIFIYKKNDFTNKF